MAPVNDRRRDGSVAGLAGTINGFDLARVQAADDVVERVDIGSGQDLYGLARRAGLDDQTAEDAVQETLVRLWIEIRSGTDILDPPAWSFRTLYRIAMDQHRLRRRVRELVERIGRRPATHGHRRGPADDDLVGGRSPAPSSAAGDVPAVSSRHDVRGDCACHDDHAFRSACPCGEGERQSSSKSWSDDGGLTMDDERLERRLRRDPTMDPPHRVGAFRDRLADRGKHGPVARGRRDIRVGGPLAIVATVLVATALIVGRAVGPTVAPGSAFPTAAVAPTPTEALPSASLQTTLIDWAHRGTVHRATLAVVNQIGETWTGSSIRPGEPELDSLSTYRIGDLSRILSASAVMSLDECGRGMGFSPCPKPGPDAPFSIDDRVARWIPDWPNGEAIRVRQLLDGTSGVAPVTSGMADLLARVAADPAADWTEAGLLARARALPPAFPSGNGFALTDTADLLLDDIIARVSGRPSLFWIGSSTTDHFGLVSTTLPYEPPEGLVAGTLVDGQRLADLPPAVLRAVGNASGVASNALDLARFANPAWSSSSIHDASTIAAITAIANPNSYGLGVRGFCPCAAGRSTVLGLTGHAAAWSGIVAKDRVGGWSLALLVDADLSDADLTAAVNEVLATRP